MIGVGECCRWREPSASNGPYAENRNLLAGRVHQRGSRGSCEQGDRLVAIATAFGIVANSYLKFRDSSNDTGKPPWQACRIEPHESLVLSGTAQKLYDELLRYSVLTAVADSLAALIMSS
jgi:hypothetical protein